MPAANESDTGLSPVKLSRLSKRGVLLGLSVAQLIALAIGVASFIAGMMSGGTWMLYSAALWAPAVLIGFVPLGGRPIVEWLPVALHWTWRTMLGQTRYRARITRPRPAGTLALPGDAAALRQYADPVTKAVMVHDPHAQTLTALLEVHHSSFVLLDPGEQERRVQVWGRALATGCRSGRIARLQILERAIPDSGSGLAKWWAEQGNDDGSWVSETYKQLIDRAGPAGERHISTISVSLDMKAAARQIRAAGRGLKGAAEVLRQEMRTLVTALRAADLEPSDWYGPGQLSIMLRSAYDPEVSVALERAGGLGQDLATAGPVAVEEFWDRLRTDSGWHAVLWISEWPRSLTFPGFLSPVLLAGGVRRAFTLLCDPMRADQAARDVRKRKTEHISDRTQRQRIGQIEDATQSAELADVLQQEADLVSGHGALRYTGLIAITAPTSDELDTAVSTIEQAAVQASCETRRLVGQQASAFAAAALPLCRGL
ncbi:SCO6880 family protein [Nesterenkonia alkaliphila]|uniref:PrgI family protein n=1 Tax=Nesterenkonia alkaliphila TaxID=1463631 RepID=A0A7K1UF22_9MICC|nr:SCO6880 family protein [Nesterenkonia alkaliphila]MVT25070.1 PrgI family protein [Nesterenkonia alkaliphila]